MTQQVEPAIFTDGSPSNLPAAAMDAAEWLDAIDRLFGPRMNADAMARLERARRELRRFLEPHLPETHREGIER